MFLQNVRAENPFVWLGCHLKRFHLYLRKEQLPFKTFCISCSSKCIQTCKLQIFLWWATVTLTIVGFGFAWQQRVCTGIFWQQSYVRWLPWWELIWPPLLRLDRLKTLIFHTESKDIGVTPLPHPSSTYAACIRPCNILSREGPSPPAIHSTLWTAPRPSRRRRSWIHNSCLELEYLG